MNKSNPWYVGGRLEGTQIPSHYDFRNLRLTPAELRAEFAREGWRRVVAFQTRNPMHRAHVELAFRAAKQVEANLLIHPMRRHDQARRRGLLHAGALLPIAAAEVPAGDRQAFLAAARHAHGRTARSHLARASSARTTAVTHFIVGRDHAGPGKDTDGKPFYGPYEAQEVFKKHEADIGVTMVPFNMMVYLEDQDKYVPDDEVKKGDRVLNISGTELRAATERRPRDSRVVYLSGSGRGTAQAVFRRVTNRV